MSWMAGVHAEKRHHLNPKNPNWLAENLKEMENQVKDMLQLVEGDSFPGTPTHKKRNSLVSHVKHIEKMYRTLAERYEGVLEELRKSLQSEGPLSELDGDERTSSSLESSDQDLEERAAGNMSRGSSPASDEYVTCEELSKLEEKLVEAKKMVRELEAELRASQTEIDILRSSLEERDRKHTSQEEPMEELRRALATSADEHQVTLSKLESQNTRLKGEVAELSRENLLLKSRVQDLVEASEKLDSETLKLDSEEELVWILPPEGRAEELELAAMEPDDLNAKLPASVSQERDALAAKVKELEASAAEKDTLESKVSSLAQELKDCGQRLRQAEQHSNEMHSENAKLIAEAIEAQQTILNIAEQKIHAIRELSATIDHYKSRYNELRRRLRSCAEGILWHENLNLHEFIQE